MNFAISTHELLAALLVTPVLAATAWSDLRRMIIPNRLSIIGLALFAASLPLLGMQSWLMHLGIGTIAFVICVGLFAAGWFGGGDAKILPVTMLFVPTALMPLYLYSFAASMLIGMVSIWAVRQRFAAPDAQWVSLQKGAAFPMGISIAAALPLTLVLAQAF